MTEIHLPMNYIPRTHGVCNGQMQFWQDMDGGKNLAAVLWHRRYGKDTTIFNYVIRQTQLKVGNYWYLYPEAEQGREALWEAIDNDGQTWWEKYVPDCIVSKRRDGSWNKDDKRMVIKFANGSRLRVLGAKEANRLVGHNPCLISFSEAALHQRRTFDLVFSIVENNHGKLLLNTTSRGDDNWYYNLIQRIKDDDDWHVSIRQSLYPEQVDTYTGVFTPEQIQRILATGTDWETMEQEYGCVFETVSSRTLYGPSISKAIEDGRIKEFDIDTSIPVHTLWDIGRDCTAVWFFQEVGKYKRFIYYFGEANYSYADAAKKIKKAKAELGITYGTHVFPHDATQRGLSPKSHIDHYRDELAAVSVEGSLVSTRRTGKDMQYRETKDRFKLYQFHDTPPVKKGLSSVKKYTTEGSSKRNTAAAWHNHATDSLMQEAQSVTLLEYGTISSKLFVPWENMNRISDLDLPH